MSVKCLISTSIPISDVGGALYTVDKQLREQRHYDLGLCIRGGNVTCMHIVVCGDIAYPTINGVSRISA